jgi:predicted AAA+ superfamily ATPase
LTGEEADWRSYITDSLVETVLARDVLAMHTINKPALLRNLFLLSTRFPAQILSYNKMLGQLQDAGNTTTLAHYLRLLETAFLVSGLERYSPGQARSRASSPKLVLWNNALVNALHARSIEECRNDPALWGRLVENAAGAHLLNHLQGLSSEVMYWRQKNDEVDYVVRAGADIWAVEVKSGRPGRKRGMSAFSRLHPKARMLVVGPGGMDLDEFFSVDPREIVNT